MKIMSAGELQDIGTRLFDAAGSPHEESFLVSKMLVRSSLAGHDSHGIMRFVQYVHMINNGSILPGAPFEIIRETKASATVDGHQGWGQIVARKAMQLAIEKAQQCSTGTIVVRGCQHIGRAGEYSSMATEEQMIGLAIANSYGNIGAVAPWGGIDGRLSPNPISFSAPSGEEWPLLVDITTSVVPEGRVRLAYYSNDQLPEGCIIDHQGNGITEPALFYGPPRGALLPLGGIAGHKGTGLAVLAELLAGGLSAAGFNNRETEEKGNGLFFQAINISDFLPVEQFTGLVQELIGWIKSSRKVKGVDEILVPGENEYRISKHRQKVGIPVNDGVWLDILKTAEDLEVTIE